MLFNSFCLLFEIFSKSLINELSLFYILRYFRGNISSPIRYSYLSILAYYNADTVATSLLMPCSDFVSLILSSRVMITLYASSNRFFQKREALSDGRVLSMTKHECFLRYIFCTTLIVSNLLKF